MQINFLMLLCVVVVNVSQHSRYLISLFLTTIEAFIIKLLKIKNMMTNNVQKLKTSLNDAVNEWLNQESESDGFEELKTYVSDNISELMTDAAFCVLLSQSSLSKYYRDYEMLTEN